MLEEKSTCKNCDFKVCPMLGLFAGKIKAIVREADDEKEASDAEKDEQIALLKLALTKIVKCTEDYAGGMTTSGYTNRIATNALCGNKELVTLFMGVCSS